MLLTLVIHLLLLHLLDFVLDFLFDFGELLLHLFLIVSGNEEAFALMLKLPGIIVCFLLQAHRLSLVQAVTSLHEFIVRILHHCQWLLSVTQIIISTYPYSFYSHYLKGFWGFGA